MANDVRVDVDLDTKKATQEAETFHGKMKNVFGDIAKIAAGIGVAKAGGELVGFMVGATKAAIEEEAAMNRLNQALRNAGGAFDENRAKVEARILSGQKLAFTDDQVRDSFQTLLAATGDVDEALRRQALAMDFARGAGIPLEQASKLLGKVTEENVEVFKRMGITIGEGATEAEAFAVIQGKFAGQSDAYAKSTAGQFEQAKIRMSEVKEQIGTALLPVVIKLGNVFLTEVVPAIEKFVNQAGPAIEKFAKDVRKYWESDIKPAVENLQRAWEKIDQIVIPILKIVGDSLLYMKDQIVLALGIIVDLIGGDFSEAWEKFKTMIGNAVDFAKKTLGNLETIGREALELMRDAIVEVFNTWIIPFFKRLPQNILEAIGDLSRLLYEKGKSLTQGFIDGIRSISIPLPGGGNLPVGGALAPILDPTAPLRGLIGGLTGGGGGGGGGLDYQGGKFDPIRQSSMDGWGGATGANRGMIAPVTVNIENFYGRDEAEVRTSGGTLGYMAAAGLAV